MGRQGCRPLPFGIGTKALNPSRCRCRLPAWLSRSCLRVRTAVLVACGCPLYIPSCCRPPFGSRFRLIQCRARIQSCDRPADGVVQITVTRCPDTASSARLSRPIHPVNRTDCHRRGPLAARCRDRLRPSKPAASRFTPLGDRVCGRDPIP